MEILGLVAKYLVLAVGGIWQFARIAAVLLGAWALIDALTRDSSHFIAAGKRTKGFWLGVNAVSIAVLVLMGTSSMLGLLGVVASAVYLADVRPALQYYAPVRVRSSIRFPGSGNGRGDFGGGRGPRDWTPGR
ncbi:DUF2516 family protein [Actinomyces sp.]|uniref:DUF2516 family protein n=1 Tax=Actinomyces sp. TaxID=29317 RepID=UPI0026DAC3C8|nr:DUF2516 family protein [Actinomyces sp.]MDO4901013.1 DUF2516 family protein [Actinomyces sp.]